MTVKRAVTPLPARAREGDPELERRYARLYAELGRPARALLRRTFGGTFSDEEIEDLYGNAWLGTLHALRRSARELPEDELRRYVLTAVANQASRELRRRGRRPTLPLELADGVPDGGERPEERAVSSERASVARDVLGTLPPRRRAVIVFRYGWGLEPEEVRRAVRGLSPRAYRREVSRGVDEIARKLGLVEAGAWCEDREPVLRAYASGAADEEQRREAERHLSHCRSCAGLVGDLSERLYDLGNPLVLGGVLEMFAGEQSPVLVRLGAALARAKEAVLALADRGAELDTAVGAGTAAGTRGTGVAGAGALAKIAGTGSIPKLVALCAGGGAATACAVAGLGPAIGAGQGAAAEAPAIERSHEGAVRPPGRVSLGPPLPGVDGEERDRGPVRPGVEGEPIEGEESDSSDPGEPKAEPGTPAPPPASAPFEPTGSYARATPAGGGGGFRPAGTGGPADLAP